MDPISFLSKQFETHLEGQFRFGDEVIDEYGMKAVVVRDPYKMGSDPHLFTLIYFGRSLASVRVDDLKKTGKSYAKELNTIFNGLRGNKK